MARKGVSVLDMSIAPVARVTKAQLAGTTITVMGIFHKFGTSKSENKRWHCTTLPVRSDPILLYSSVFESFDLESW